MTDDYVCLIGLVGCIFLYFLGQLLYPDIPHKTIIPEPNKMLQEEE